MSAPSASPVSRSTESQRNFDNSRPLIQEQKEQYQNSSEGQHASTWTATESQQSSHDTMVANWASSAAANLEQHQIPKNITSASSPLNDTNINFSRSKLDEQHEISAEEMQVGHNEPSKQVISEEREYRVRNHSSGDCRLNSPRQRLSEERSSRIGRDLDTSSTRGRSHTPASRSRSPHSAHNISVSPESRSGRNRNDRTPTPINGYETHAPIRILADTPQLVNTEPETATSSVNQPADPMADGDILDDVSDISEGDIPDIPALSDDDKEGQHTHPIDTASGEQVNIMVLV